MATIHLNHLYKAFSRGSERLPVLDDFCLTVEHNEFVCLLGPSGCGKSTTLDVLAGLTQPDGGEVVIAGTTQRGTSTVGYVFQRPRLLDWRTVRQNVDMVLAARGRSATERAGTVERYLALVGLSEFADVYPRALSGGMQQRVSLARALAIEPDVLLMDEPFSSLDELTARRLRFELLEIVARVGTTVLFVTHNALEAAFLADRICIISQRPARVREEVTVPTGRPREPEDPDLVKIQRHVLALLESPDGDRAG